jgi:diacylglycerol kinase (ATP)
VHKVKRSVEQITAALDSPPRLIDAVHVAPHVPGADSPDFATWGGQWFAGVLSLGLDAAVNARANTYTWPPGPAKYVRAVVSCLANFKPYGYTVRTDDEEITMLGTLVAVANSSQIGGGMRIAPDADLSDGLLDVLYATALSKRGIAKLLPSLYRGRHMRHPAVHAIRTTSVIIEPTGKGEFPPVAFADGEVVGPVPLRAQVHQGAFHVLA